MAPYSSATPSRAVPRTLITDRAEHLLAERLCAIHEQERVPLTSVDLDDTLLPFGQLITEKELRLLQAYAQAGGHLAFNTLASKEWFYLRVVELLALVFHREGCSNLLSRLHWIVSGGSEIFVYECSDQSYRRTQSTPTGSKAKGLSQLLRYLGNDVAVLALYGDRFDDPGNDGNAIGNEDVPLIINVGADRPIACSTAEQVFINTVEKGPPATLRYLAFVTERLRELSKEGAANVQSAHATGSSQETRTWRFESADDGIGRPDALVEVEVHGPGFVWSWNPQGLCWLTPLVPNLAPHHSATRLSYTARLPRRATKFTFFWTGGEDTKTGHSPGHWEGCDFVVST